MRITTFLLGGLVGATVVALYRSNNKSMMFSSFSQAGESVGKMMKKVGSNLNMGTTGSNNFVTSMNDEQKVKDIINEDPHLKNTYNEVVAENNLNKPTYQTQ